jgi:hypothetical protein
VTNKLLLWILWISPPKSGQSSESPQWKRVYHVEKENRDGLLNFTLQERDKDKHAHIDQRPNMTSIFLI